jgi:hypothetical protein
MSPRWTVAAVTTIASSGFLVAVVTVALAQKPLPQRLSHEHTFQRSVRAGGEVRIFTYARWHRDCSPAEPPSIEILTPPAHGTTSIRPAPLTVDQIREGEADCTGKTYTGTSLRYAPTAGFHGTDRFDWNVYGTSEISHDSVVVEVR